MEGVLLTRHGMSVEIGSDGLLQLMIWRGLLKPQAQVVLQVLVQLVTWRQKHRKVMEHAVRNPVIWSLLQCSHLTKR